ncbi:MAG TPA: hypothetical protein VGB73_14800 [Pyrinomonadaceae bacterium]|jgi:hypothetical protein
MKQFSVFGFQFSEKKRCLAENRKLKTAFCFSFIVAALRRSSFVLTRGRVSASILFAGERGEFSSEGQRAAQVATPPGARRIRTWHQKLSFAETVCSGSLEN